MSGPSRRKRALSPESSRGGLGSDLIFVRRLARLPLAGDGEDADDDHHWSPGEEATPGSNSPAWARAIRALLSRGRA